jgi:hypothetical protein
MKHQWSVCHVDRQGGKSDNLKELVSCRLTEVRLYSWHPRTAANDGYFLDHSEMCTTEHIPVGILILVLSPKICELSIASWAEHILLNLLT